MTEAVTKILHQKPTESHPPRRCVTPTAPDTTPNLRIAAAPSLRQRARQLYRLGINVIPLDGHKRPIIRWRKWKTTRQTLADVEAMPWEYARGIAVVCGAVSGGLVCFDLDKQPDRAALDRILTALGLRLDYAWQERTPGGGYHVYFICPDFTPPSDAKAGKVDRVGRLAGHIEARLEGVLTTFYLDIAPSGLPATVDGPQFGDAYDAATVKPAPEDHPASKPCRRSDPPPADSANLYEAFCMEVEQIAIRVWSLNPPNSEGYSQMIPCPLHKETKASAHWNYRTHSLYCFGACGREYNAQEVGEHLGLVWKDYKEAQRPVRTPALKTGPEAPRRYPGGLPITSSRQRMELHLRFDIKRQDPLDALEYLFHEIPEDVLPEDAYFSVSSFVKATQKIGRNASANLVEAGLKMALAFDNLDMVESADLIPDGEIHKKCNGQVDSYTTNPFQNFRISVSTLCSITKPTTLYRFKPAAVRQKNDARVFRYGLREWTFKHAPDLVQAEFGGHLTDDQRAVLDDYSAGLGLYNGEDHREALAKFERMAGWLDADQESIEAGTNFAVRLPEGEISSAGAYRLLWLKVEAARRDVPRDRAGLSNATLSRHWDDLNLIPVPRSVVVPCERVTPYQREHGLVLAMHGDGTATIRAKGVLKSRDRATREEIKAFEDSRPKQQANRKKWEPAQISDGDFEERFDQLNHPDEHDVELVATPPTPSKPLTVPADYSEAHKRSQYHYRALEADGDQPIEQLWQTGADLLMRQKTVVESELDMPSPETIEPFETEGKDRPVCEPSEPSRSSDDWPETERPINVTDEFKVLAAMRAPHVINEPTPDGDPDFPYLEICRAIMRGE